MQSQPSPSVQIKLIYNLTKFVDYCSSIVLHQAPYKTKYIKKKKCKTMYAKAFTLKQQTLIKSAKGGLREATQHNSASSHSHGQLPEFRSNHLFTSFI